MLSERHEESGHPADRPGGRRTGRDARGVRRPGGVSAAGVANRLATDHGQVTGRYGDAVTSGVVRDAGAARDVPRRLGRSAALVADGRVALVVGCLVTADLLTRGCAGADGPAGLRGRQRLGACRTPAPIPLVWAVTQVGGRVTILVVLAVLVGYLAWRRRTWLPLVRVLIALAPADRRSSTRSSTAPAGPRPASPAPSSSTTDGASFPSGHVANAVLMWGVARWQAVEYGLPPRVQRGVLVAERRRAGRHRAWRWCRWTSTGSPTRSWAPRVGVLLLGVVHALDAVVLSRWVRARAGRQTA